MRETLLAALVVVSLGGCAMIVSVPVTGQLERSAQRFKGVATANYSDGTGTLSVVALEGGVDCKGDFTMINQREGRGVLVCSDKRSGPFEFVSAGRRGTGNGLLGGERFTFTFGE